jgi:hypothetical protein
VRSLRETDSFFKGRWFLDFCQTNETVSEFAEGRVTKLPWIWGAMVWSSQARDLMCQFLVVFNVWQETQHWNELTISSSFCSRAIFEWLFRKYGTEGITQQATLENRILCAYPVFEEQYHMTLMEFRGVHKTYMLEYLYVPLIVCPRNMTRVCSSKGLTM